MLVVNIVKRLGTIKLEAEFAMPGGEITALFGPSGAGKSTLINCIAGLCRPDRGRIVCHGINCFDSEQGVDLPPEKRALGYVFQDGRLFPHFSVRENLLFGRRFRKAASGAPGLDDVIALLDIAPLLSRRPAHLSGGEKQRVAIGRALLCTPRVLLMDEPLTALDLPRRLELMEYIKRIPPAWGVSVLYVTHSPEELAFLADKVLLLRQGCMEAYGSLAEMTPLLPSYPTAYSPLTSTSGENHAQSLFA